MGNHDEKCIRWFRHEEKRRKTGKANPMRVSPERAAEWAALTPDDVAWLQALPLSITLPEGWIVVHAGFEAVPMDQQRADKLVRVRYIDPASGEMVPYEEGSLEQPPGTVAWMERWAGPESVVYGHAVHDVVSPRIDRPVQGRPDILCVGIDTGCAFGGHLTALVLEDGRPDLVQVPARRCYFRHPKIRSLV